MVNGSTVRNHLMSIDANTGIVSSWDPNANQAVSTLAIGGSTIYVGGSFTSLNGSTLRNRLAAIDATSGTVTSWNPNPDLGVYDLSVYDTRLYVGGQFTTIEGLQVNHVAAYTISIPATCSNPVIGTQPAAQTVCAGSTVSFSVSASGPSLTYQWRNGTTNIAGATNAIFTISNAALSASGSSYNVVVSSGTCSTTSNSVTLTVNPNPVSNFSVTSPQCIGSVYTYTNSSSITSGTIANSKWDFNDGFFAQGSSNPSHIFSTTGTFLVKLVSTSNNGCMDSVSKTVVVNVCTAVPEVDANITSIALLPNAVKTTAVLQINSKKAMQINWIVSDENGREVMKFTKRLSVGQNNIEINLAHLPQGLYQLTGNTNEGKSELIRFVKM